MSTVSERVNSARYAFLILRDDRESIRMIPNVLVQCTFPQQDPGDVNQWCRSQNGVTISIQPYLDDRGRRRYPCGAFARLLLYWISWEAINRDTRKIYLRHCFQDFARQFEIRTHGRDRDRLMDGMMRLFRARIEFREERRPEKRWKDVSFTSEGYLAWDEKMIGSRLTADSFVVLGEGFFDSLKNMPIPIDLRAILTLKHSAMALDLYTWSSYQTFRLSYPGEGREASARLFEWRELMYQFGSNYQRARAFKEKFPHVLEQVLAVYPELRVETLPEGLKVFPSRAAVLPGERKVALEN